LRGNVLLHAHLMRYAENLNPVSLFFMWILSALKLFLL
jgi:hypothetical protein